MPSRFCAVAAVGHAAPASAALLRAIEEQPAAVRAFAAFHTARPAFGQECRAAPEEIGNGHDQQDQKKGNRGLIENCIQAI